MSSYEPPLSPNSDNGRGGISGGGGSVLSSVMTETQAKEAKTFAKEKSREFQLYVNEGNWSLRLLALLGGLAMIIVSLIGLFGNILTFRWISALFQLYAIFLGTVIVALESGKQLSIFSNFESTLYKNALFLKYVWGRGVLYFVAGSIQISLRDIFSIAVGGFVCLVGITYILVGRRAAEKLAEVRRSALSPRQIEEKFIKADADSKGSLTMEQFRGLTVDLGMDLTRREVESAFIQLDRDQDGRLTYEAIHAWWTQDATNEDGFIPI